MVIPKFLNVNYEKGRGGQHPNLIVIHIIGMPGYSAESAYSHFLNPASEVSAHYIIKRTGEVWQCVRDEDTAWSNGSIGYKNGVPILPDNFIAMDTYLKGIRINQISLSIENEGSEYEDITEAQYKANVELIKALSRKYNIPINSFHVCGHKEIKATKLCPGKINVSKIIALANAPIAPVAPVIPIALPPPEPETAIPEWMKNLLWRVKSSNFGNLMGWDSERTFGAQRAPEWNEFRKAHIKSSCEACGRKSKFLKPLQLHHILPFHLYPDKELEVTNIITFCDDCHLLVGHLMNFSSYNKECREDAKLWRAKITNRP